MTNKNKLQTLINRFADGDLKTNALALFKELGYSSSRTQNKTVAEIFKYQHSEIIDSAFLFQLAGDNLDGVQSMPEPVDNTIIESYMFVAIELRQSHYSRSDLVKITRELNKSQQPILILFKHGDTITLSVINRRLHKKDDSRDVLEKVTLLKDIRINDPHRAHVDILEDLVFDNLKLKANANFVDLHNAWLKVLSIKTLNDKFYEKLFNWYLFALSQVEFPQIRPETDLIFNEQHQSESLIRLLTRILFVWFMKEKGLISAKLFDQKELTKMLKNFTGENCNETIYYKAILQNLFFATLNMPIDKRKVIEPRKSTFPHKEHGYQLVYRYVELFNDSDFEKYFAEIPFLNGGLFDCLDRTKPDSPVEIRIDDFTTSSKKEKQAVVPDKLFFGEYKKIDLSAAYDNKKKNNVTVYGLIDILKNHKFTIEENTPLEEDIALDPELLGQIFENLLAAYQRKQTGSFYTPREIVDYMVDESLITYFSNTGVDAEKVRHLLSYHETKNPFDETQTKDLIQFIDNLKILDPACGSGAFPMGILNKLVFVLSKLDKNEETKEENVQWRELQKEKAIRETDAAFNLGNHDERATRLQEINDAFDYNSSNYGRKLYLIENCIHGVDIQPIATQISKLRFFISLIVDQKPHGDKSNNFGIRPLPNLDFKIIAANTLIAAPQDDFENNALFSNDAFFENFSDLTHDYFKVANPDDKRKLRDKIETLINAKCDEKLRGIKSLSHNETKNKKQIDQLESHQKLWQSYANLFKHEAVAFFEPRYFFPQLSGGFDIVIGNPPYVQIQKFSGQQCQKDWQAQNYETFVKTGDIYALFIEKGVSLLKQNGLLAFITSNKWMRAGYGKSLRNFLATKTQPLKLIDFGGYQVFDAATVDSNILITQNVGAHLCVRPPMHETLMIEKSSIVRNTELEGAHTGAPLHFNACTIQNDFTIQTPLADYFAAHSQIMPKMSEDVWVISSGIEQQIKAKIEAKGTPLKDWDVNINYGIKTGFNEAFIINTETKERLCNEDPKSAEIIKPILRGRDIKRYAAEYAGLWLIFIPWHFPLHEDSSISGVSEKAEIEFEKQYPAIYQHLTKFKNELSARNQAETGICYEWYALQRCAATYWREFEKEKIIYREISDAMNASYVQEVFYCNNKVYIVTGKSLKYLLSIFNSTLFNNVILKASNVTGGKGEGFLSQIPIPKISESEQQPFIQLVDEILAEKKAGNDTSALEREIDGLVYGLYGLSEEEILIVEGKDEI